MFLAVSQNTSYRSGQEMGRIQKEVSAGCFILCCTPRTKVQNPRNIFNEHLQNKSQNGTPQTVFSFCVVKGQTKTMTAVQSQPHFIWSLMRQSCLSLSPTTTLKHSKKFYTKMNEFLKRLQLSSQDQP